jgi:hypothetical protein
MPVYSGAERPKEITALGVARPEVLEARDHAAPGSAPQSQAESSPSIRKATNAGVAAGWDLTGVKVSTHDKKAQSSAEYDTPRWGSRGPRQTAHNDPRSDPLYVDNVLPRVVCMLAMADRYDLVWNGGHVLVFNADIDWQGSSASLPLVDVHRDVSAAKAAAAEWNDVATTMGYRGTVSFYHAGGNAILPTYFSPQTAPRTHAAIVGCNAMVRKEARAVTKGFEQLRNGMVVGFLVGGALRMGLRWLPGGSASPAATRFDSQTQASARGRGRTVEPVSPVRVEAGAEHALPATSEVASRAQKLAQAARAAGEDVVVNMGGAGGPHEPANALNVNNQAVARQGIPNLVEADASGIGDLFEVGSVDRVEGHNMAPGVIDWNRAAPGAFRILKPGGRFEYYWRGANADARVCANALRAAGFRDVQVQFDVIVSGRKPGG